MPRPRAPRRPAAEAPTPAAADKAPWTVGPWVKTARSPALVALMLRFPSVVRTLRKEPMDQLVTEKWREVIRRMILAGPETGGEVALGVLTEGLPEELASEISALVLSGQEIAEEERDRMTADCLFFLQRRYLMRRDQELCRAIRVAEETRDDEVKKERMRQWQEVMQRKLRLERERPSL